MRYIEVNVGFLGCVWISIINHLPWVWIPSMTKFSSERDVKYYSMTNIDWARCFVQTIWYLRRCDRLSPTVIIGTKKCVTVNNFWLDPFFETLKMSKDLSLLLNFFNSGLYCVGWKDNQSSDNPIPLWKRNLVIKRCKPPSIKQGDHL